MLGAVRKLGDKLQKIVVLSNADCISNAELGMSRKTVRAANFNLILETFRWFTDGQYPVSVNRPKGQDNVIKANYDKLNLHKAVFIWFFPLLLAALGAMICIRRYRE